MVLTRDREVISTESMVVRIGTLHQDRARFVNYPPFQREKVWRRRMKQVFIDSILRKLPVNSCLLMEDTDATGGGIYQVIDGQQRLETIFEFLENGFPTMSEDHARAGFLTLTPVEPHCTFSELTQEAQNRFQNYKIPFVTFAKKDEDVLEEIFLRTNNQEPLSVGEQLFVHQCKARALGMELLHHEFWNTIYTGRKERKDHFQAALSLMAIEVLGFPLVLHISNQSSAPLNQLVLGELDDSLSTTLLNTIWNRLTAISHVFTGAKVHSKRDIIPVYEAAVFLDNQGFDLPASEKGCLTQWFVLAKRGNMVEKIRDYHPFARIEFTHRQREFWELENEHIQHLPGLVRRMN